MVSKILFVLVSTCSFLAGYEASLCYNCSSLQQPTCLDPFSTEGFVPYTCQQGTVCVKVITESEVTRGCSTLNRRRHEALQGGPDATNCYTDVVSPSFKTRTICMCEDDFCNTAVSVNVDVRVAVVAAIARLLLWTSL